MDRRNIRRALSRWLRPALRRRAVRMAVIGRTPERSSSRRSPPSCFVRALFSRSLGGLDETFESYLEDVEFGLRCASNGYTGLYEPRASCHTIGQRDTGPLEPRTVRNIARNQVLLVARHYDCASSSGGSAGRLLYAQALWGMVALRHGAGAAWIGGKLEGLRMFRSCRRLRGHPRMP